MNLLGTAILYVSYPIRVTNNDALAASCPTGIAFTVFGFNSDFLAIATFAIAVYIFIKYDIRKLVCSYNFHHRILGGMLHIQCGIIFYYRQYFAKS